MNILIRIKDWISELNEREFYRFLIIAGVVFVISIGIIIYTHYSYVGSLQKQLKKINQSRTQARELLQQHEVVLQQQHEVDEILSKDQNFRIKEYFTQVLKELNLEKNMTKPAEVSEPQDLNNGYTEIKLEASGTDLSMKQLADLLYKIEQNERIYTKELMINKSAKSPTIDITLVIATLQQKTT